jgi:hypothetical protein
MLSPILPPIKLGVILLCLLIGPPTIPEAALTSPAGVPEGPAAAAEDEDEESRRPGGYIAV